MATDGGQGVLTVSIREASPPMLKLRSADCTWKDIPALGQDAALGHTCTGGNPRATLQFVKGNKQVVYNLAPGSEPTEAQRQTLLDLGTSVQGSQ